jgi:hypothetical protein
MTAPLIFEVEVASAQVEVSVPTPVAVPIASGDSPTVIFAVTPSPGPKGDTGASGDGTQVFGEIPSGAVDGANNVFTPAHGFQAGSTAVYVNGLREVRGQGYTESSGTIVLSLAPSVGDQVFLDYLLQ